MQIESLKVFCDLAETESFTKAAQINGVTQSAVSQQISSLERQFKSLLIERSKKKFRLTREGQVLYDYSKQIIQTYDGLQQVAGDKGHHLWHDPRGDDLQYWPARFAAVHQTVLKGLSDRPRARRVSAGESGVRRRI